MFESAPSDPASLVRLIYDCVDDPAGWTKLCDGIQFSFGLETSSISLAEGFPPKVTLWGTTDVDQKSIEDYNNYYFRVDPLVTKVLSLGSHVPTWRREQFVDDDAWAASEIWNDLMRRRDLFHAAGVMVRVTSKSTLNLNLFHAQRRGPIPASTLGRVQALIPHLQSAGRLRGRFSSLTNERDGAIGTLDSLAFGVVLIDESSQIVSLNAAADSILAANDGVWLRDKKLRASDQRVNSVLERLITGAVATSCGRGLGPGGVVAVERPSLKRPYSVQVLPLPMKLAPQTGKRRTCCAVLISDPERRLPDLVDQLRALYAMTPSEARVAQALYLGLTLDECAERFGVSREAVRKHLAQIFRKTETSRQAELIRLIHLSIPAVRDNPVGAGVTDLP